MKDLIVADIKPAILKRLIIRNHYSGTCSSITIGYGVWYRNILSGGIVFSPGVGRFANVYCRECKPSEVLELTRLWLSDSVPKNGESRVISIALRALKHGRGRFRAVLSYADESVGHVGTIYQATNWHYMGQTKGTSPYIRIGDTLISPRSLNSKYGTHSIPRLKTILGRDDIAYEHRKKKKHAYVYPLDDTLRPYLIQHAKPYPKRPPVVDRSIQ